MPRPTPEKKRAIEERKAKHAKGREEAAKQEARVRARVESLLNEALTGPRGNDVQIERIDLVAKLEHHRLMALSCYPPQVSAANNALFLQAKLLGMVVDQAAVVHADAGRVDLSGDNREVAERILESWREKVGSFKANELLGHLKNAGLLPKPMIELLAEEEETGGPDTDQD
jgi:hypothetical protein